MSKIVIVYFDGLCSADMHLIEAKENTNYIWYFMLSDEFFEQTTIAGSRTVLHKINQKELLRIRVRIPSLAEQQEIVRILDDLLAKEQKIKDAAEAVLAQIELLKKSILARAFRGELCLEEKTAPYPFARWPMPSIFLPKNANFPLQGLASFFPMPGR